MWVPLHLHSHFSLLDGLSKPNQIASRIEELDIPGCALTDHGVISGVPPLFKEMGEKKKKSIAGCEFYLSQQDATIKDPSNRGLSHLCVLARNKDGWRNLMKASSTSFRPEYFYYKQRLNLERLASFSEGTFITFSGHMGSDLANIIFEEPKLAYRASTEQEAKSLARKNWAGHVFELIEKYQTLFGVENFFVEIQCIDHKNLPASVVVAEGLRWAAKKRGVPCVATADSHYCRREDAVDQRVLLCTALDTTLEEVQRKLDNAEDVSLGTFFKSNSYHIPSPAEMAEIHTEEEMANSVLIFDRCEEFGLAEPPRLPQVADQEGGTPNERLRGLCDAGLKRKVPVNADKEVYVKRVNEELEVLSDGGLSPYFLIVHDYCEWARKNRIRMGRGRGSAAGCLVSFLADITNTDPVEFGLLFARFYDSSRKGSLPDIDTDFSSRGREKVFRYIREKYGSEYVAQICTFSRMQGRSALKDVLRAHSSCTHEEANRITEFIPDESEINDQLQEMRDEGIEPSIIKWALLHNSKELKEWCHIDENDELSGPFSIEFAQAIRLEGTKRGMGKHASGLIISSQKLSDVCPMIFDKSSDELIVGVDYRDGEAMGLVKFDILGLPTLDRISDAQSIVRTGVC